MRDVVARQVELGLSVVNDGEQGRADYTVYVKDRLIGFSGESAPWPNPDVEEFPEWTEMARQFAPPFQKRPACTGPVTWKDWPAVERDIRNLADAAGAVRADDVFMTSPSPGQIGRFLQNRYYRTDEEYLYTLAGLSGPRPRPAHAVRPPDARGVPPGSRDARRGPRPRRGRHSDGPNAHVEGARLASTELW